MDPPSWSAPVRPASPIFCMAGTSGTFSDTLRPLQEDPAGHFNLVYITLTRGVNLSAHPRSLGDQISQN